MPDTAYRRSIVALTALMGATLLLWAFLIPAFRAPDEPHHYNSVMRLATGGGWPAPGSAQLTTATLTAAQEAGLYTDRAGRYTSLPRGIPRPHPVPFADITPIAPADRAVVDHRRSPGVGQDQMTQHPPLYYALGAGVIRLAGALDWRWDQQVTLLRLLSVALGLLVVPLVAATARAFSGSNVVGVVAATMTIGIGQFTHIMSTVTNDVLVNVLGLALTYLLVRALTRRHTVRLVVATGMILGLGLLTKGFFLAAIPTTCLVFLVGARQNPGPGRRLVRAIAVGLIALAAGGWWWARNLLVYGSVQPSGWVPAYPPGDPTRTFGRFVYGAVARFTGSFFGNFGWLEIPLPTAVVQAMGIVGAALVVGGIGAAHGRRIGLLTLLTLPAGVVAIALFGGYQSYLRHGHFPGLQGRYLYVALGVLVTAAALTTVVATRRIRPSAERYLPAIVLAVALASAGFSAFWAFQAVYQPVDQSVIDALVRWDAWSILPRIAIGVVGLLPVVVGLGALVQLLRASGNRQADVSARAASRPDAARSASRQ